MSTSNPERFREYSAPTRALVAASAATDTTTTDTNTTIRPEIKAIRANNSTPVIIGLPATDTIIGVTRADVRRLYATTLYDPALKLSVPAAARSLDHLINGRHTTDLAQTSERGEDLGDYAQWSLWRRNIRPAARMLSVIAPMFFSYNAIAYGLEVDDPRLITIGAIVTITVYLIAGLKGLGSCKDIPALDFGTRKDRTLVADIVDASDYLDTESHVIDITDKQLAASLVRLQHHLVMLDIELIEEPELDSATTAAALHELWSDYEKLTTSLPGLNATITRGRINREHAAIKRAVDSMLARYETIQREVDEHRDLILEAHSEIAELTTSPALEQIESLSQDYDLADQDHDLGELDLDNVAEQPQPEPTPPTSQEPYFLEHVKWRW